jgi:3-oxoacyl-[acyl-carrier-protein] synthase-1
MGDSAGWAAVAMKNAIEDSGLTEDQVSNPRTGIIAGSGGPSSLVIVQAADTTRKNNSPKRIGPFAVPKAMSSTVSATLATHFQIKGVNYSITSACTTSLHCIGSSVEQIQWGKQDIMFAGGGEELEWSMSSLFDAMGAMSSNYNDTPKKASRAFVSSLPAVLACWVWKNMSTPKPAARRFTQRLSVMLQHRMAMIWSHHQAKVRSVLCAWHWKMPG